MKALSVLLMSGLFVAGMVSSILAGDAAPGFKKPQGGTVESFKLLSCVKQLNVDARIDEQYLKNSVQTNCGAASGNCASSASTVNYNQVQLGIYGSNAVGDSVECHYKSKNGDIPNIVYKFACKNANKGKSAGPDDHSFTCKN